MKTNHPAHGPVSLDRLHQISEILSKAAVQSDGGNLGYAMADAVKVIDGAIATFGAEPVAYMRIDGEDVEYNGHNEFSGGGKGVPLYTTPPAPVVAENCVTAEHRRVIEMLLNVCGAAFELADDSCQQDVDGEECHVVPDDSFKTLARALDEIEDTLPTEDADRPDVFLAWAAIPRAVLKSLLHAAQPEPAVLEEMTACKAYDLLIEKGGVISPVDSFVYAWNACRAAMLQGAEPASNCDEFPLDYIQGHKDGLEWAAQLAEANHPQTGDWLYDDPTELARAIRKGPDMPTVQDGNSPVAPDCNGSTVGKALTITLPDTSSKAFWSGTGKSEVFHPETYKCWAKEAIERACVISGIGVVVK